jgi:nucleoside-diphosphate-sugar epimerase
MLTDLFILGASGFVGTATVDAALEAGLSIGAWARTEAQAQALRRRGLYVTTTPEIPASKVVIDLMQPKLPTRLSQAALIQMARYRVGLTRSVLSAVPSGALYLLVSGTDDFEGEVVSHESPFTARPSGFAHIGLSVRREVLASRVPFGSFHLGTVYGPGKAFASMLFPRLAKGRLPIIGSGANRLPLIHVADAARAMVHLAVLDDSRLRRHPWIITDGTATTQRALLELGAQLLEAPAPRSVPRWFASLVAGSVGVASLSRDVPADPSALFATGFTLRYPSIETGMPASIAAWKAA